MRLRKAIKIALQTKLATIFFNLMPSYVSIIFGKLGFTRNIKKDSNLVFKANNYRGNYKLWVHGDRFIEKEAASNFISPFNPIKALSKINLKDFIVIDIGANVGTISIYLLEKVPETGNTPVMVSFYNPTSYFANIKLI